MYVTKVYTGINTCDSNVQLSTPDMQPLPASIQQPSKCVERKTSTQIWPWSTLSSSKMAQSNVKWQREAQHGQKKGTNHKVNVQLDYNLSKDFLEWCRFPPVFDFSPSMPGVDHHAPSLVLAKSAAALAEFIQFIIAALAGHRKRTFLKELQFLSYKISQRQTHQTSGEKPGRGQEGAWPDGPMVEQLSTATAQVPGLRWLKRRQARQHCSCVPHWDLHSGLRKPGKDM